jgi:xanthine dehydrogenase small subunit
MPRLSQCGFCTPGFVMSLFALYQNRVCQGQACHARRLAQDLSGNLCRCTGYRPILDAAQQMAELPLWRWTSRFATKTRAACAKPDKRWRPIFLTFPRTTLRRAAGGTRRAPQAQLVAGCTDVGLWVTKQHRQFAQVLDVTRVAELRRIDEAPDHTAIGAAVRLATPLPPWCAAARNCNPLPARFAGLPVRNAGTLGGNVANGSPIGDSMPLLIALRARVVLASPRGERTRNGAGSLYTGYRQNVMASPTRCWPGSSCRSPAPGEFLPGLQDLQAL